jgi:thioesterase domain-containing protein/acyl carrier protein
VPPRDPLEFQLVRIWEDVLKVAPIGIDDDFFDLGGHSLLAVRLMAQIQNECGIKVPLTALFEEATVEHLASVIRDGRAGDAAPSLVPLQRRGSESPFFFVHQAGGNVMGYLSLARHLGTRRPFYGLQSRGLDGREQPLQTIEAMAASYIDAIRAVQPRGPYHLGGHSLGGRVAFEMARQLEALGEQIALLAVVDVPGLDGEELVMPSDAAALAHIVSQMEQHFGTPLGVGVDDLNELDEDARYDLVLARMAQHRLLPPGTGRREGRGFLHVYQANMRAVARYRPSPCASDITVVATDALSAKFRADEGLGWQPLTSGRVHVHAVPGDHMSLLKEPDVAALAARLSACLDGATAAS